jgi:sugar transferase (PEP-CTERM system associated)
MLKIGGQKLPVMTVALVLSEGLLILLVLMLATLMEFGRAEVLIWPTLGRLALVALVCQSTLYYYDLYDLQVVGRRSILFVHLLNALGVSCLVLAIVYYCDPKLSPGRHVALFSTPAILTIVLGWRLLVDASAPFLRRSERLLVVGTGASGIRLVREVIRRKEFNLHVVGFLDEKGENIGHRLVNPGIIGAAKDMNEIVSRENIDHIVLSLAERRGVMPVRELLHLKFAGIRIEDARNLYERLMGRIMLEQLNPSWLILSEGFRKSRLLLFSKRLLDIAVSLMLLLVMAVPMLLITLAIWLESGSPILFRQKRVGVGGREFEILKFRSMYPQDKSQGPSWTSKGDRRITRVGHFIRNYRLDEVPQLINVLFGDMSIVGPRPEQPQLCEMLEEQIPFYSQRHAVRPGISGWAQVKYEYGGSVEETRTKLEYDLFYVKHMSVFLDLAIMFETAKVMLSGRGAK